MASATKTLSAVDSSSKLSVCVLAKEGLWAQLLRVLTSDARADVDLNELSSSGQTALHYAAAAGESEVCQLLLRCGADPNIQDGHGQTALHCALAEGSHCVASLTHQSLCACFDWSIRDGFGRTVLHWVCGCGHLSIAQRIIAALLKAGGEALVRHMLALLTNSGQSCMHWAVRSQQWPVVEYLLRFCAAPFLLDLTTVDSDGHTAADLCTSAAFKERLEAATREQLLWKQQLELEQLRMAEAKLKSDTVAVAASAKMSSTKPRKKKKKMKIKLKK